MASFCRGTTSQCSLAWGFLFPSLQRLQHTTNVWVDCQRVAWCCRLGRALRFVHALQHWSACRRCCARSSTCASRRCCCLRRLLARQLETSWVCWHSYLSIDFGLLPQYRALIRTMKTKGSRIDVACCCAARSWCSSALDCTWSIFVGSSTIRWWWIRVGHLLFGVHVASSEFCCCFCV